MRGLFAFLDRLTADRRGQVAIVTAIAAPVIIAGAGMGAETGLLYYKQREAQMSADLAAYAGAVAARSGQATAGVIAAAETEARVHGYDPARGPITVNTPPASGANQDVRAVEAIIEQSYPRLFMALLEPGDVSFTVRAVARYDDGGEACILALDPMIRHALLFTGSTEVNLAGCDLMSNSLHDEALGVTGSGRVTAPCANAAGGAHISARLELTECPAPRTGLPPALDPFAGLEPPTASGCRNIPGGGGSGARTIQPGRYCNGMAINGDVVMAPGVYIVDGGVFRTNGNATLTGEGVIIFLTGNATVQMNGNARIDLSAPTSGPYAGLVMWGDAGNAPDSDVRMNGTADSALVGALYFPSQTVEMRGDFSGSGGCTRIVASRIDLSGNSSFASDCTAEGVETVRTPGMVRLVE
jgi:hypothetical protein